MRDARRGTFSGPAANDPVASVVNNIGTISLVPPHSAAGIQRHRELDGEFAALIARSSKDHTLASRSKAR
jgi:hypothetical protein